MVSISTVNAFKLGFPWFLAHLFLLFLLSLLVEKPLSQRLNQKPSRDFMILLRKFIRIQLYSDLIIQGNMWMKKFIDFCCRLL